MKNLSHRLNLVHIYKWTTDESVRNIHTSEEWPDEIVDGHEMQFEMIREKKQFVFS